MQYPWNVRGSLLTSTDHSRGSSRLPFTSLLSSSLMDYIERFRCEVNNVVNPLDESILTTISAGLRKDGKLYESIYKSPMKDLGEFYERAVKEIRWEEIFSSKKPEHQKDGGRSTSQNKKRRNDNDYKGDQGQNTNDQADKKMKTK